MKLQEKERHGTQPHFKEADFYSPTDVLMRIARNIRVNKANPLKIT